MKTSRALDHIHYQASDVSFRKGENGRDAVPLNPFVLFPSLLGLAATGTGSAVDKHLSLLQPYSYTPSMGRIFLRIFYVVLFYLTPESCLCRHLGREPHRRPTPGPRRPTLAAPDAPTRCFKGRL